MMSPRPALAVTSAALAAVALAGCQKPNPGVTVWSGTNSEHVQALCWQQEEDQGLGPRDCAQDLLERAASGEGVATVAVTPGDTVGVSVDTVVAESGWSIQIGGQPVANDLTGTYHRFTFPENVPTGGAGYTLQVIATAEQGGSRGYWFFQLLPR